MQLGAYAIVRYANDLRDERLNIGVLVWHPLDGFRTRFLSSFDRVQAIEPAVRLRAVHKMVEDIQGKLRGNVSEGRKLFGELSAEFREGLQVSDVFPARLHSLDATADRLYSLLIEPSEVMAQANVVSFPLRLAGSLKEAVFRLDPNGVFEELGTRRISGVSVNVGLHTKINHSDMLWRAVSLRARAKEDRLARAKAAVMDITRVRLLPEYRDMHQIVTVQLPKNPHGPTLSEYQGWIRSVNAEIIEVADPDELPARLESRLLVA